MEYSLCNIKGKFQDEDNNKNSPKSDNENPISKKGKFDESLQNQKSSEYMKNLIENWIIEYKIWYKITFGVDINLNQNCNDDVNNAMLKSVETDKNYIYQNTFTNYVNNKQHYTNTPCQEPKYMPPISKASQTNMGGYWGPLLRYGTYGVYKIYDKSVDLNRSKQGKLLIDKESSLREVLVYPLDPPLRIRMPRQAMICTLQSKIQLRLQNLRKLEKDPLLHMSINYSNIIEQVTKNCGTCPKYLYTKISNLPKIERQYFTFLDSKLTQNTFLSLDGSVKNEMKSTNDFYACELQISDIIIAQGFALWKRRAREICARNAFRVLEKPCYLVGSIRFWYGTDYMTACTSDDPQIVPILPPFLTDPTEPLYKKDEKINESNPDENFDILNPKSLCEFWLYAPTLKPDDNIKSIDPQTFLYQSAEFSQMNLSFEIESCWDESFSCTIMIDKSAAIKVDGLGSLEQACRAASLVLVDKLVDTQPIVIIDDKYHQQYNNLEYNDCCHDNEFLVRSLMYAQHDLDRPIYFKKLSDYITCETVLSMTKMQMVSSEDCITCEQDLEYLFNIYAQSSLVDPLRIDPSCVSRELWSLVIVNARKCGLVVMNEYGEGISNSLLICKQVPHSQLKAKLLRDKCYGIFMLKSDGHLPDEYLQNLQQFISYDTLDNEDNDTNGDLYSFIDGPMKTSDNYIINTDQLDISTSNQSSYSDIINDIPRDLIPGLDF